MGLLYADLVLLEDTMEELIEQEAQLLLGWPTRGAKSMF